jgi:hypothetical protein
MKNKKSPEILTWVFFGSQGVTDNTDLMRCMILTQEICRLGDNVSVEKIKNTSAYCSCLCNIPDHLISDIKLQEMIDFNF